MRQSRLFGNQALNHAILTLILALLSDKKERYKYTFLYTGSSMVDSPLFDALVRYHVEHNLPRVASYLHDGQCIIENEPVLEGQENERYKGVLIVANGSTLVDKLVKDEVLRRRPAEFVPLPSPNHLLPYLNDQEGKDGAYLYDGVNRYIAHVARYFTPCRLGHRVQDLVPPDFLSYDGSIPIDEDNLGTKTQVAMELPFMYRGALSPGVTALQIKRSGFTALGVGKVTRFTGDGLAEEFFFQYRPDLEDHLVPAHGLVGVHRTYARQDGRLLRTAERVLTDLDQLTQPLTWAA